MSVDSVPTQKAFAAAYGGLPYPLLADFHPKGAVGQAYGIYNEERGTDNRSVFVIDKEGVVRWARLYDRGLPDPDEVLAEVKRL